MDRQFLSNEELDELIRTFGDMVYRIAVLRCSNTQDADDVYQDVFLKLVHHAARLGSREHIKAWLIRVTINQCNTLYGSSWHQKTVALEDEPSRQEVAAPGTEYDDTREIVYRAVQQLRPPEYRDVIYLFYYEELSVREISNILQITEINVKVRLNRARKKLRTVLEKEGVSGDGWL